MFIRRLMIRLRIALILIFVLGSLTVIGGIIYLNNQGLNKGIRQQISTELENHGVYVEFDSLKYHLSKGLIAENVTLYTDATRESKVAFLPNIIVNFDKTKLLRGIRKINSISLINGNVEMPINPYDPNGTRLEINDINGTIVVNDFKAITTNKLTAKYQGVQLEITANLWQESQAKGKRQPEEFYKKRAETYSKFLEHLDKWDWSEEGAPFIQIQAKGDLSTPQLINIQFTATSSAMSYQYYLIEDIIISGDYSHNLLTLDKLQFYNNDKSVHAVADYDFKNRDCHYQLESDIHLKELVSTFFDKEVLKGAQMSESIIRATGEFTLPLALEDIPYASVLPSFANPFSGVEVQVTGTAKFKDFQYLGSQFTSLSSDFSWHDGDLYLDRLNGESDDGFIKARLLIKDQLIQYKVESTLPLKSYKPFFPKNPKLEAQLKQIKFQPDSSFYFKSSGNINANDLTDWASKGSFSLTRTGYGEDISTQSVVSNFDWNRGYLKGDLKITGAKFRKNEIQSLTTTIEWKDSILSLTDFSIPDLGISAKKINSNIQQKEGKLNGNVTIIDAKLKQLVFGQLDASVRTGESDTHGRINVTNATFRGQSLIHMKSDYQLGASPQLKNIDILHSSGGITGTLIKKTDGYFHYNMTSTADPNIYIPLLHNKGTQETISKFGLDSKSKIKITSVGKLNSKDLRDWQSTGSAQISDFKFNGVPLKNLSSEYKINASRLLASNAKIEFDYTNYTLRRNNSKGARSGEIQIAEVLVDNITKTTSIRKLSGKAYPAPIARMFHTQTADHIEEYHFYDPPNLSASGIFDNIPRETKDKKIDFYCNFACPNSVTHYKFLDGNVALENLKVNLRIKQNTIYASKISATTFKGPLQGEFTVNIPKQGPANYSGKMNFKALSFRDIGITYNFDEIPKGELTGNLHFTGQADNLRKFNASGSISLDKGNIFSAPVLGPISLILNPILGKGTFNERLKNLSATFIIEQGVVKTDNIQSLTPSMTFVGEGSVDLVTDQMDMTVRINYRGIIGKAMEVGAEIVRLPFNMLRALFMNKKPEVAGLLQIRGTGKYKDPKWRIVQFDVNRGFKGKLFNPPKALIVP